jgi:RNA polymerase sigma-70 factor, ECF subfamily
MQIAAIPLTKTCSCDLDSYADSVSSKSSDQALITAVAYADRKAMQLLFGRFKTPVYRFARRLGADHGAAEDIVSEVFLDVWRKAGTFKGQSSVSTWLLAITRNKAIALSRRRDVEPLDDDSIERIEDESDGPETVCQKQQVRSILQASLKRLAPVHREIIDLVYYHDRSIQEVAHILNIPSSTVKTRMFYARSRLAQMLANTGKIDRYG